jgi:hypothetical protein
MKKLSSAVAILVVAALLTGTLAITPKVAAAGATMYVVPASVSYTTSTGSIGTLFNVSVWCTDGGNNLGGADVKMYFNDSFLNVTQWFNPTTDPNYFYSPVAGSPLPAPPDPGYKHYGPPNSGQGSVEVAISNPKLPPAAPWAHTGLICIFEFNITAVPTKNTSPFTCTLDISSKSFLLDTSGNTLPNVVITDGSYTMTWSAPTSPWLAVSPTTQTFGPNPPSAIGQTFLETITLMGYKAAWGMSWIAFDLQWNSTVIDVLGLGTGNNITVFSPPWTVVEETYTPGTPDDLFLNVTGTPGSDGDIPIASLLFTVLTQATQPPAPSTYFDYSQLHFTNEAWDQQYVNPAYVLGPSVDGSVTIWPLRTLKLPYFFVDPSSVVLGPQPVIGQQFTVGIGITGPLPIGLDAAWYVIGAQFTLTFDDSLIAPIPNGITEGPFFGSDDYAPHGTFFSSTYYPVGGPGAYVIVGTIILPNSHGVWDQTSFANGTGIIAYITFQVVNQQCPNNLTTALELGSVFGQWLIDVHGNWVQIDESSNVNGMVTILPFNEPGRAIDLVGGAVNDGYGYLPLTWPFAYPAPNYYTPPPYYLAFKAPWGGQGNWTFNPNTHTYSGWMDLVFPQSYVYLDAYVTYNYWPVQSKDVGFEIEGPFTHVGNTGNLTADYVPVQGVTQVWAKFTSTTDANGVATYPYRMPWPCVNPDSITGVWKITSTVTIADQVVSDIMMFYYERPVYITKVTTDSFYYTHDSYVSVTVNYKTHSVQQYPALFAVVITDELGVPFGMQLKSLMVGGATWCTWLVPKPFVLKVFIPKYAYAGFGAVHVSVYDKDPTVGGEALCPEYLPDPQIQIGPE